LDLIDKLKGEGKVAVDVGNVEEEDKDDEEEDGDSTRK
jgi:hypothetical protein